MTPPADDFPCIEIVEVVTDYLDGAMAPADAHRFEEHLALCAGCASVVDQFRTITRLGERLQTSDVDALPPEQRQVLLTMFRDWAASRE